MCWYIDAIDKTKAVSIWVTEFTLESKDTSGCSHDALTIYDGKVAPSSI